MGAFSVNEAIGQAVGATLREKAAGRTSPNTEQLPAAPEFEKPCACTTLRRAARAIAAPVGFMSQNRLERVPI